MRPYGIAAKPKPIAGAGIARPFYDFPPHHVGADALIGPQALVLLSSSAERRCAERRDLSGGRDGRDGQLMAEIF